MQVTVIGCGVMGSALARHFSRCYSLILCDRNQNKTVALAKELNAAVCSDPVEAVQKSQITLLAIKPKDLRDFSKYVKGAFSKTHLLISILGATSLEVLRQAFPEPVLVRALPNLPVICGKGVVGFATEKEIDKKQIEDLFQGVGLLSWVSEPQLEALSALAGSGPAFIFVLIEAMMESGVFLGFKPEQALDLVLQTLEGSIALLKTTQKHPAALKLQVASPGGTTIAGLKVLEESSIRGALMNVFLATYLKKPLS